jgi:hypothetical protein
MRGFLFSAQRFFVASEMRFLPATVIPLPRFLGVATAAAPRDAPGDFELRAAHRAFIAWDSSTSRRDTLAALWRDRLNGRLLG